MIGTVLMAVDRRAVGRKFNGKISGMEIARRGDIWGGEGED